MQKKLIALAIASAFSASAFAESTVNVYGLVDGAIVSPTATGYKSSVIAASNGLSGSRLGVKAVEDLDNGMKAVAVLEYALDVETNQQTATTTAASGMVARQQMLALAGDFGTVATGYLQTTGYDFGAKYDVVAGSAVSPLSNITGGEGFLIGINAAGKRAQRALAYISPKVGGVTVAVNYSTAFDSASTLGNNGVASSGTSTNVTATLLSANYEEGPLAAGVVYAATNKTPATGNASEMALGVSYNLGVATVKATYQNQTTNAATSLKNSAMSVGATVPVATGIVAVSYAKSTMDSNSTNKDASGYTVAFLQPMSKTTTAYAAYSAMNQSTGGTGVSVLNNVWGTAFAADKSSVIALGLNKKF
ncbi:MAG: porin [Gallionellaceae bacterium]